MSDSEKFEGPADEESPEEYHASDAEETRSPETGTTYDRMGETERTPHDEVLAAEAGESHNPNAASSAGLEGHLGLSSERTGPADETGGMTGVEGTGTVGSARASTHGTTPTTGGPDLPESDERENPAEVPSHPLGHKNPGHSGG